MTTMLDHPTKHHLPWLSAQQNNTINIKANKEFFSPFCLFSTESPVINSIFPADYFRKDLPTPHQITQIWFTPKELYCTSTSVHVGALLEKNKEMLIGYKYKSLLKCGLFQWASSNVQQAWKACNPQPLFAGEDHCGWRPPFSSGVAIC